MTNQSTETASTTSNNDRSGAVNGEHSHQRTACCCFVTPARYKNDCAIYLHYCTSDKLINLCTLKVASRQVQTKASARYGAIQYNDVDTALRCSLFVFWWSLCGYGGGACISNNTQLQRRRYRSFVQTNHRTNERTVDGRTVSSLVTFVAPSFFLLRHLFQS